MKNENLKKEYDDIINQQVNDGIIEKADISKEYKQRDEVIIHYLPHHAFVSEKKVRVVYEGNAKSNQFSKTLNECLYRGPNLIVNLCGVLLRFRMNKIAFTADIKKAYLQLQLNPQHRDVTRFLWVKGIHKDVTVDNIQEYRFCRVICGIISAAFLLAYTIYNTPISKDISRNIYVNNLISGTTNTQDPIDYHYGTKEIFNAAEMTICKWSSNDENLMNAVKPEDGCDDDILKVLGLIWNRKSDTISLCKVTIEENVLTKRKILHVISCIYDPLGLFAPAVLPSKLLLQEVWKLKLN